MSTIGFKGVTGGLKVFCLVASITLPSLSKAQVPVFVVTPEDSSINFFVKASVAIGGTFDSRKVVQTGPDTFDVQGDFTIRGVTKPETLTLTVSGKGTGTGAIKGTLAFDRKDYGMNSGIPFIKIANRVEVTVGFMAKQVSGPRLVYQQ